MAIFKKPAIKAEAGKKREIPRGLFQKCPGCSEVVPEIELAQNQRVCPRCDHHFAEPAKERIQNLLDPETFVEMDANLKSVDVLRFQGMATYKDRLKKYQESTGLFDAVTSGYRRSQRDEGFESDQQRIAAGIAKFRHVIVGGDNITGPHPPPLSEKIRQIEIGHFAPVTRIDPNEARGAALDGCEQHLVMTGRARDRGQPA